MNQPYLRLSNLLRKGILLSILFLSIAFNSFSQTTNDSVHISRLQAVKISKDLLAYKDLKKIDSINLGSIVVYQNQLSLKDSTISLINLKVQYLQKVNENLTKINSFQQDETKQYQKQTTILKIERDGIAVVAAAIIVKLIFFK